MTGVAFFDIDSFQLEEGVVATEYERPAPAPDYPIEIHSLNDFDIVSQKSEGGIIDGIEVGGRNYFSLNGSQTFTDKTYELSDYQGKGSFNQFYNLTVPMRTFLDDQLVLSFEAISPNGKTPISVYNTNSSARYRISTSGITSPINNEWVKQEIKITVSDAGDSYSDSASDKIEIHCSSQVGCKVRNVKLEKGTKATDWTPAPEDIEESDNHPLIDKINLLMDEPLRSVGDVKDRLFRDSDRLWKVERNIGVLELANHSWSMGAQSSGWNQGGETVAAYGYHIRYEHDPNVAPLVTNLKGYANSPLVAGDMEGFSVGSNDNYSVIRINKSRLSTVSSTGINNWIEENNPIVYYALKTEYSTIEILSQSLQDKLNNLRSFKGSNYVYTVDNNNLNPNLNVVFKSKGWKHKLATDSLEIDVSNKADRSDVEEGFSDVNETIDEFRRNYESYQDSAAQSMENANNELQKALDRTAIIEANLGEGAADWIFTHTQIRMSDEGVTIGQKEAGSYLQISDNQISFFNGSEDPVAFINGGMLHINHAIFVESIQISEFMISSEISGHITFRYVGGS